MDMDKKKKMKEDNDDDEIIYYEMPMFFWQGEKVIFVIDGLESTDGVSYGIGWLGTVIFGFLLEGLFILRTYLVKYFIIKNLP
mgnify:CR=1 FL=1